MKKRITWLKSGIGCKPQHRRTMAALGLRRRGQTVVKVSNPAIDGMIKSVEFLLRVEDEK